MDLRRIGTPAEPIAQRHKLLITVSELTDERAKLEDKLVLMLGTDDTAGLQQIRARLSDIQDERLRILGALQRTASRSVKVFISYAHEDNALRDQLVKHLAILKRQGTIRTWHDREIVPGTDWAGQIDAHLETAQLILLLISPDFVSSDYCYEVELKRALERHEAGQAMVIPVILRPVMWSNTPFAKLQALPTDGRAVTSWSDRDAAFLTVAEGIRGVIESLAANMSAMSQ